MARQIAAHVTLVYPWEAPEPEMIAEWVPAAVAGVAPFRLAIGPVGVDGPAARRWCGYAVEDLDGGHAAIRARITAPEFIPGTVPPHITIVHPRTSSLADEAHAHLRRAPRELEFWVNEVTITAWDGERWQPLKAIPLRG
jgi:hypothetical protein